MRLNIFLFFIIVILILFIFYNYEQNKCDNGYKICSKTSNDHQFLLKSLDGYWISNTEFNNKSEIDKMTLYIDFSAYTSDLIIIINNNIKTNDKYHIYIDEDNVNNVKDHIKFKISFVKSNKNQISIWDNKTFTCLLSPLRGSFQLYDNDNVLYGDFTKDYVITNFINNL